MMWKFLLALCAVVHLCQGRLPRERLFCEEPFVPVGDRCLYFDTSSQRTHDDAREVCHSLKGELAAMLTARQFKDTVDYIYNHGYDYSNFWIDGTDAGHEGLWLTSDNQPLPMGTPFWYKTYLKSEPSNSNGLEHCLELQYTTFYYQNDQNCNDRRYPLCEMKDDRIAEPAPQTRTCPPLYVSVGNDCIAFAIWEEKTWAEARQFCHGLGGELATVDDIELLREVYNYLHLESILESSFWIGGSDIDHEGSWTWTNGQSVSMGTPFWGRKAFEYPQEPSGGTAENCLYLDHNGGLYFFDGDCDLMLHPLCMA